MGPWLVTPTTVQVALRDASYYLERQVPRNLYGGTGGLDGEVGLAGQAKPLVFGGPTDAVIKNMTPVLVDPANLIYQVNDGPVPRSGRSMMAAMPGSSHQATWPISIRARRQQGNTGPASPGLFQLGTPTSRQPPIVASSATLSRTDQLARYLLATAMNCRCLDLKRRRYRAEQPRSRPCRRRPRRALGSALYVATDDAATA